MMSFGMFKMMVDEYNTQSIAEDKIAEGLKMMGSDTNLIFDNKLDFVKIQLIDELIGDEAAEVMGLWMWDYNMGTKCPPKSDEYETLPSDIEEFFNTELLPRIKKHYASV